MNEAPVGVELMKVADRTTAAATDVVAAEEPLEIRLEEGTRLPTLQNCWEEARATLRTVAVRAAVSRSLTTSHDGRASGRASTRR